jgi:hypothetical protein
MKRMATTGTSAGVTTPMRETVGGHNHPLGAVSTTGSPASPSVEIDPPSPTVEAGVPAPGPSTRSQTRVPVGNTVGREAVDEMEENQGEDPLDGAGLSEQDEALSDGESSVGNDSQVMGPLNLQELVRLGQEHCRTPCRVRNSDGVQVASICGKKNEDCQRHAVKRSEAKNYQYAAGSYPRVSVVRGFTGHGLANGTVYSDAQLNAFKADEAGKMATLVQTMIEDADDVDEMEELARDLRVHFKASETHPAAKTQPEKMTPAKEDSTDDLRKALAAKTAGPKAPKGPPPPNLWFGMITVKDARWITANPAEANEAAVKKRCRVAQVFHTMEDAEAWLEVALPALVPRTHSDSNSDADSDSDDEENVLTAEEVKKMNALVRRRRKKHSQKARKKQSASGRNDSSGHSSRARRSSTKGGRKKAQSGRRSSTRRGHKDVCFIV